MSVLELARVGAARPTTLSTEEFGRLREIIYAHAGIYFPDNKKYLLESRLARRLAALHVRSFGDYLIALQRSLGAELPHLIEAVTINETFFFRNTAQLDVLVNSLLPAMIAERQKVGIPRITLWSAASSSGEEAYTLAMVLREKIQPRYPQVRFRILATDIDSQVLDAAKVGLYRDYAIRQVPPEWLAKYFRREDDRYRLSPELQRMVEFRKLNLYDAVGMRAVRQVDVIFCANVLIYFDQASKKKVISAMYDSLNRGGALFLGFSESLHGLSQAYRPVHFDRTIAYMKD